MNPRSGVLAYAEYGDDAELGRTIDGLISQRDEDTPALCQASVVHLDWPIVVRKLAGIYVQTAA